MEHVNYNLYWNTFTVILIETNFNIHHQEHLLFLFRMDHFLGNVGGCIGLSETGVFGGKFSLSNLSSSRMGFSAEPPIHLQTVKRCCWRNVSNARSKDSVYIQLSIFSIKFNIVHIGHLIPACVHILCTYTWKYFVPHFMCSLLARGNWKSG